VSLLEYKEDMDGVFRVCFGSLVQATSRASKAVANISNLVGGM
jgi:hypothetical protein